MDEDMINGLNCTTCNLNYCKDETIDINWSSNTCKCIYCDLKVAVGRKRR